MTRTCPPCTGDCNQGRDCPTRRTKMSDLNPYEEGLELELQAAQFRIKALEAKLAKAVEALEWCATVHVSLRARATLAEIKGESHD